MTAHSKWNVQPLKMTMNQETIDHMIAAVEHIITFGGQPATVNGQPATATPVHLLVKEKEFKYGKGKEYIAFTDGGPNQFGKDVKYVKFFYHYYDNNGTTGKMKPNDKTYTFGLEKARTFWNDKVKEGYTAVVNSTTTDSVRILHDDGQNPVDPDVSQVETTT